MGDDEELERLRQKKLMAMQQAAAEEEQQRFEEQKNLILRQILTPEAKERLARVRMAYPNLAMEVERQLIMLATSGRLGGRVDDRTLKEILRQMSRKKEIKIKRI